MDSLKFKATILLIGCLSVQMTNCLVKQPDLLDVFLQAIGNVSPCLPPCLLKDIGESYNVIMPCVNKSRTEIYEFITANKINNYTEFYNKALLNTKEKPSPFCKFYDGSATCFYAATSDLCGARVVSHLQKLGDGVRSYANCERNMLPILECMAHPYMVEPSLALGGYATCVGELILDVNNRFIPEGGVFNWPYFYAKAISERDAVGFKVLLTTFGICVDNLVAQVDKGCGTLRGVVLEQVEIVRHFLDYADTDGGTDALKCLANPSVLTAHAMCNQRLVWDLNHSPQPNLTERSFKNLVQYAENDDSVDTWPALLLWYRNYYLTYSTCIQMSMERYCMYNWSTQEIMRVLKPTDRFFTDLRPAIRGPDCQVKKERTTTPIPSGGITTIPAVYLIAITIAVALFKN